MDSASADGDLTARAAIRNAALRLFAQHGHDAVTVREIASAAGVSAALVVHHFGSKEGLRQAVDVYAAGAFDTILAAIPEADLGAVLSGGNAASLAEAFVRGFPAGSPLPAYLRRLLLTNDPAGAALFGRWYATTVQVMRALVAAGIAKPSDDLPARAAFLLVNDLALILLRNQVATVLGVDPLSPEGLTRWATEASAVYADGVFHAPGKEQPA
jgi:AcrR family transcriptional regulator